MRSYTQSLVILIFCLLTFSAYADELSRRYKVPHVKNCPVPEQVTVTVTVIAPASEYIKPSNKALQKYPESAPVFSNKKPIPSEYKSCYDRNHHHFNYSYHHGEYHFGVVEGGPKTGEPNAKGSPTSGYISKSLITSKGSPTSYIPYYPAKNASSTAQHNSASAIHYNNSASNTNTTSGLPKNSTVPGCLPDLQLDGAAEYGFNKRSVPFSVKIINCSKFDIATTTAFANFAPVSSPCPLNPRLVTTSTTIPYLDFSAVADGKIDRWNQSHT